MSADLLRSATDRKAQGAHYTPSALADFVAERIAEAIDLHSNQRIKVLDPACGDGSLMEAMAQVLVSRGVDGFDATGFDTSPAAIEAAASRLVSAGFKERVTLLHSDFLTAARSNTSQVSLFDSVAPRAYDFDVVIANPPYVRTQVMGARRSQQLAGEYGLTGRVDLYFAFVRAVAEVLRPGGIAGLIVSNRFMSTQAGDGLRTAIREHFDVLSVVDFGDTRLFQAAVLPAVLVLRKKHGTREQLKAASFISVYSASEQGDAARAGSVFDAIQLTGHVRLDSGTTFMVRRGHLDMGSAPGTVWRLATELNDNWLAAVASKRKLTFGDIGQLRVGVKTTADKVFIRGDWDALGDDNVPELLRPLTTHRMARRFKAQEASRSLQILYPHEVRAGRRMAVDLSQYPRAARYLETHRSVLEGRSYVREAGREWFELWVPQDPAGWAAPKLVWRDISERPVFWMDRSGAVVNGDCYWLSAPPEDEPLLWLALAVANSRLIEVFYDSCFNNRLYAGRRRFITQYVRQFPLPDPDSEIAQRLIQLSQGVYDATPSESCTSLMEEIDELTWQAFDLNVKERIGEGNLQLLV